MATTTKNYNANEIVTWAQAGNRKLVNAEIIEPAGLRGQYFDVVGKQNTGSFTGPLKVLMTFDNE